MNIRFVIRTFLLFQRVEVFLAVLLPFFLILESAIANAWAYAGGSFDFHDGRTYVALGRGLFFEVLTYSCAKLVKVLCRVKTKSSNASAAVVGFLALVAILVSAGNNLAWVASGHELGGLFGSIAAVLPPFLVKVYGYGLGLLLPVAVGVLALVDIEHLVNEALTTGHLDNKALQVHESEMHRTEYLKSQKSQKQTIADEYDKISGERTKAFIERVKKGDMSFGSNDLKGLAASPAAQIRTTITPVSGGSFPGLPPGGPAAGNGQRGLPPVAAPAPAGGPAPSPAPVPGTQKYTPPSQVKM